MTKRRKKVVAYYRSLKRTGFSERDAAKAAAEKWGVSASSIRIWEKAYQQGGYQALMDKPKRPNTIHFILFLEVKLLVVVIRTLLGWGAPRISAELERRDIAKISHFLRYHLPTKTYHPKGKSDGIKYTFSGKLRIQTSPELHRRIALEAAHCHVSINTYLQEVPENAVAVE